MLALPYSPDLICRPFFPPGRLGNVQLFRFGNALVLTGVNAEGSVELLAWTNSGAPKRHQLKSANRYSEVTFDDKQIAVLYDTDDGNYEEIDVTFQGAWRELTRRKFGATEQGSQQAAQESSLFPSELHITEERAWTHDGHKWL